MFHVASPAFQSNTLEGCLDELLPIIQHQSKNLLETGCYISQNGIPWLEFRSDDTFLEKIVHYFLEDQTYLYSVRGNVTRGNWTLLSGTNKIMITVGDQRGIVKDEIYELVFLSAESFILRKDGHHGNQKYLVLGFEPTTLGFSWSDYVNWLYETHRKQRGYLLILAVTVFIIAGLLLLSF